jgi:hypothetical protein
MAATSIFEKVYPKIYPDQTLWIAVVNFWLTHLKPK